MIYIYIYIYMTYIFMTYIYDIYIYDIYIYDIYIYDIYIYDIYIYDIYIYIYMIIWYNVYICIYIYDIMYVYIYICMYIVNYAGSCLNPSFDFFQDPGFLGKKTGSWFLVTALQLVIFPSDSSLSGCHHNSKNWYNGISIYGIYGISICIWYIYIYNHCS